MPRKNKNPKKEAEAHHDLEGFDITIDPFGQMESSYTIEKLNEFLNKQVKDKKILHQEEEEE